MKKSIVLLAVLAIAAWAVFGKRRPPTDAAAAPTSGATPPPPPSVLAQNQQTGQVIDLAAAEGPAVVNTAAWKPVPPAA